MKKKEGKSRKRTRKGSNPENIKRDVRRGAASIKIEKQN